MSMFVKRAGRFIKALLNSANGETFTPVSSIEDVAVTGEEPGNVDRTIEILRNMEFIETVTDENGNVSIRLTPSGVNHVNAFNQGGF